MSDQWDAPEDTSGNIEAGASFTPVVPEKKGKVKVTYPSAPASTFGEQRTVKLLNTDVHGGRYAVIDVESQEGYLVPGDQLAWTVGEQVVAKSVLDAAERPYNWDKEIEQLFSTPQQVRIALWQSGAVTEEDARGETLRSLVARLLQRGVLPVKE